MSSREHNKPARLLSSILCPLVVKRKSRTIPLFINSRARCTFAIAICLHSSFHSAPFNWFSMEP